MYTRVVAQALLTRPHKLVIVTAGIYSTYPSVLTAPIPSSMEVKIVARERVAVDQVCADEGMCYTAILVTTPRVVNEQDS